MTNAQRATLLANMQAFIAAHANSKVREAAVSISDRPDYLGLPGRNGGDATGEAATIVKEWRLKFGRVSITVDEDVANDAPATVQAKFQAQVQNYLDERDRNK